MNYKSFSINSSQLRFRLIILVITLVGAFQPKTTVAQFLAVDTDNMFQLQSKNLIQLPLSTTPDARRFIRKRVDITPDMEINKLMAPDVTVNAQLGTSVAVDLERIVIGAPNARNIQGSVVGKAYVFRRIGSSWEFEAELDPFESINPTFGASVAISGNTIAVGAPRENSNIGAVYIFVLDSGSWVLQQHIVPSGSGARAGTSLAIDGDTLLIGADRVNNIGLGFVYVRADSLWSQQAQLIDSEGDSSDRFGLSVDLDGDTAVIGAPSGSNSQASDSGIACVFVRLDGKWTREARLWASDAVSASDFGADVSISGNNIVVGDPRAVAGGAAYVYVREGEIWSEQQKLRPKGFPPTSGFGSSVAIWEDQIFIGDRLTAIDGYSNSGGAYLFTRTFSAWDTQGRYSASDARPADFLGTDVDIKGTILVAGAPGVDSGEITSVGAAYVFIQATQSPDLRPEDDTGISDTDNITSSQNLTFDVLGATQGATIELLRDGIVVDSKVSTETPIVMFDNGVPPNITYQYTTRQIVNGEVSSPSYPLILTIDTLPPITTINQGSQQADPSRLPQVDFETTFSEPTVGFGPEDISLAGSTANISNVGIFANPVTGLVAITNVISDGQFVRASVVSGAVADLAGNIGAASISTDNTVTVDNVRPSISINQTSTQPDPTTTLPINFTVIFSEPVTGFNQGSIAVTSSANLAGRIINVTGSGTIYNVSVSNFSSNGQAVVASIPNAGNLIQDVMQNPALPSTSIDNTITVDNVPPTVTVSRATGQANPTNGNTVNFRVVYSEIVTGFDASDISFVGSTVNTSSVNVVVTGSGTTYNVAVSNLTSNGETLRVTVPAGAATDMLGNLSLASTGTSNTIIIDNVPPTVTINQAKDQIDPAFRQPVNFTVVFNEVVTGFGSTDVSLINSTADISTANIIVVGSGANYNVSVSNIKSSGQIVANVLAGAAADSVGNSNSASTSIDNTISVFLQRSHFDYDGDGKTDVSLYRPSNGLWFLQRSTEGETVIQLGTSTDKITPADFDGDGKTDVAVYRAADAAWYVYNSSNSTVTVSNFGLPTDIAAPADYDGDGKADIAIYRPSTGQWWLNRSTEGLIAIQFGVDGDIPVAGDYDGDGEADLVVFRPSNGIWYMQQSTAGGFAIQFGNDTDKLAPADYDGDGKMDVGIYRPSQTTWYSFNSSNGSYPVTVFGLATDIPVPGDYDGDGKADIAIYRPTAGQWWLDRTTSGLTVVQYGSNGDIPTPNAFRN